MMTVAKAVLVGLCVALVVGLIVLFRQYVLKGIGSLVVALWMIGLANSHPSSISLKEQERRRRSFVKYKISQDIAHRREAHREAMAQWS